MSPVVLDYAVAAVLWSAIIVYAIFAGADFGGGVWDLLARGPRAEQQRRSVTRAMGPVWEANHVWLIFMLTGLFTAFPSTFAALAIGLFLPFTLVLFGIICRGTAFAFRSHASESSPVRAVLGRLFGGASIITPFLLGACAGAVAGGGLKAVEEGNGPSLLAPWTTPFALTCGGLALAICAGLAAAYLCVEEAGLGHRPLAGDFRRRALSAGAAAGLLGLLALAQMPSAAPLLWHGMLSRGLPLAVLAAVGAGVAGAAMLSRHYKLARAAAAGQVAAILGAWAFAQAPYLVPPNLSVEGTASPSATMAALLVAYLVGGALLVPSLLLLFRVFKGRNPAAL